MERFEIGENLAELLFWLALFVLIGIGVFTGKC